MGTLLVVKGLPLSYNRDLQETQEALFDSAETLEASLAGDGAKSGRGPARLRPAVRAPALDPFDARDGHRRGAVRRGVPFRTRTRRVARWAQDRRARSSTDVRDIAARRLPSCVPS